MEEKMQKSKKPLIIRLSVIALFIAAAVLSAIFAGKVSVNYNLANYLKGDTQTKAALDVIEEEFGGTGTVQVMAKNVSVDTADEICDKIKAVKNVITVNYDKYSEIYYKNGNALFIAVINGDDYSENAKSAYSDIKDALTAYDNIEYGGATVEKQELREAITSEMVYILAISLCLVVAILLISSKSWIEPIVLLIASGAAVLINKGTNVFFGEISYITDSISAILQLALSIDYSIVLLHAYRKEKETAAGNDAAMMTAIKSVVKPVSASALTTLAGLLALLFMSFKIGFDIGIVLMKGIVISAITSLTLLPALILSFDKLMKKTGKKAFIPKGGAFVKVAEKGNKVIVVLAVALIIACGFLQTNNSYIFSDSKAANTEITDAFGANNSVAVVYKNQGDGDEKERLLIDEIKNYKTSDGKSVYLSYSGYSNTVHEVYDVKLAAQKLDLNESDAEMLFTMYNLYNAPSSVTLSFKEFVNYANNLAKTDEEVAEFIDEDSVKTLKSLAATANVTFNEYSSDELYLALISDDIGATDLNAFYVKQIYGVYFYDTVENNKVDFKTMLNFTIAAAENENFKAYFTPETVGQLKSLNEGIAAYESYYPETDPLRVVINGSYGYEEFLPALSTVATALTGSAPELTIGNDHVKQIYVAYFYATDALSVGKVSGKTFAEFTLSQSETDECIKAGLSEENKNKLSDMLTVNKCFSNGDKSNYIKTFDTLGALQGEIKSDVVAGGIEKDKVSGVFIKYALNENGGLINPIVAENLLGFVSGNMDENALLIKKMTAENRDKVNDANIDVATAKNLFKGENYSRILISVDLPNESEDTTEFVAFLTEKLHSVFGDDAYAAGEIVSTYDLEKTFDKDNAFITVFTIISIFLIVAAIFKSLSLPLILVAIIQGAIFMAMSTQIFGDGIFFMSYIVTTCILMGATIDYGILASTNYVSFRRLYDKKESLKLSVEAAMPTVFTSGLILTVCGFVIHFISGQNSISTVGLLIGIGALCSMFMITLVLPSVLYALDKFVLKLSLKKK